MSARYVVNAGGTPNISGFIIDPLGGHLVPLPNSQRPLAGGTLAMPGDISFNADGSVSVTNRGYAIVSEAGSGAASSYEIDHIADLELVSGSVALGQNAPCWLVTTRDGRYAYTANAGSGTISSLGIAPDGVLSLLNPVAGTLAAPLDLAITGNSKFLYAREGNSAVSGFKIAPDGSLTLVGSWTGLPAGAQGIAAR